LCFTDGDAVAIILDPSAISTRLKPKDEERMFAPLETTISQCGFFREYDDPNFKYIMETPCVATSDAPIKAVFEKLHQAFEKHDQVIEERNKTRDVNVQFMSESLKLSVSL
jgi:hypothetical protein